MNVTIKARPLNISLPEDLKNRAVRLANDSEHGSISRFVQHLLYREIDKAEERKKLKKLLAQGVKSGVSEQSPEEFFASVRARLSKKNAN